MMRDRGNLKWTAMMLPEHVARLKQLSTDLEGEQVSDTSDNALDYLLLRESYLLERKVAVQLANGEWQIGVVASLFSDSFVLKSTTLQHYVLDTIQRVSEAGEVDER